MSTPGRPKCIPPGGTARAPRRLYEREKPSDRRRPTPPRDSPGSRSITLRKNPPLVPPAGSGQHPPGQSVRPAGREPAPDRPGLRGGHRPARQPLHTPGRTGASGRAGAALVPRTRRPSAAVPGHAATRPGGTGCPHGRDGEHRTRPARTAASGRRQPEPAHPQDGPAAAHPAPTRLPERHPQARRDLRRGTGRHRQDLAGRGLRHRRPGARIGVPAGADASGRGGRRAPGLSCPATWSRRSTPTCGRSTTPSTTCWVSSARSACSKSRPSRSPRWPTCAAAP